MFARFSSLPLQEVHQGYEDFISSQQRMNLQPQTYDFKREAPVSNVEHNITIDNSVNAPLVEVNGTVGEEKLLKTIKKTVGKEIYQLKKEQSVALRTYMGRS